MVAFVVKSVVGAQFESTKEAFEEGNLVSVASFVLCLSLLLICLAQADGEVDYCSLGIRGSSRRGLSRNR